MYASTASAPKNVSPRPVTPSSVCTRTQSRFGNSPSRSVSTALTFTSCLRRFLSSLVLSGNAHHPQPFSENPHPQPFSSPSPLGAGRREKVQPSEGPLSCLRRERGLGVRAVTGARLIGAAAARHANVIAVGLTGHGAARYG